MVVEWERFPGSLRERCPTCGEVGYWASTADDAPFTPPTGHTVIRAEVEGIVVKVDACPKQPTKR
jgi:hypothetical protein